MRKIDRLKKEVTDNLDLIIGSVVMYRSKCGKNCTCNNGEKHITYYLSSKKKARRKIFIFRLELLKKREK